jgi:hypothetical protein
MIRLGNRTVSSNLTRSASLLPQPVLWPNQGVLNAPSFGSGEVKALHCDSEPASQNFLSLPNFL